MLSKGAEQPPKHIGLAMTVRHMTGSKEIVRMLNHYGHCISYDELERLDTAIANEIIQKHETDGIVLPNNIRPGRFIHFAADNNDLNEETLDGKSTTYATTLVMYQEQDIGHGNFGHCFLQQSRDKRKERRRTISKNAVNLEITEFHTYGRRPSPVFNGQIRKEWFLDGNMQATKRAESIDNCWWVVRLLPRKLFEINLERDPLLQKFLVGVGLTLQFHYGRQVLQPSATIQCFLHHQPSIAQYILV